MQTGTHGRSPLDTSAGQWPDARARPWRMPAPEATAREPRAPIDGLAPHGEADTPLESTVEAQDAAAETAPGRVRPPPNSAWAPGLRRRRS